MSFPGGTAHFLYSESPLRKSMGGEGGPMPRTVDRSEMETKTCALGETLQTDSSEISPQVPLRRFVHSCESPSVMLHNVISSSPIIVTV